MSNINPWDEITSWGNADGGWRERRPSPVAYHDAVFETLTGKILLNVGVWPGDPRRRYMWIHRGFYSPFPVIFANYWDAIVGDHLVMNQATFDAGYAGDVWETNVGGLFVPYI